MCVVFHKLDAKKWAIRLAKIILLIPRARHAFTCVLILLFVCLCVVCCVSFVAQCILLILLCVFGGAFAA